ncbi:MAG: hypothetical protein KC419_23300 [Anaerolineales bacterium]|nr:hypothetical protein [Anaerolineales bacterium]MCA9931440.1 hypothetical protein [Anaerolineales bacterium]
MHKKVEHRDDLTKIKGIGSVRQKWFANAFSVCTFAQLAALSVDEIEKRLKSEGKIPSRNEIKAWVDQAKTLAALQSEWKPLASFVVEFQTRVLPGQSAERRTSVHYMEADTSMTWFGIEKEALCQWMNQQANLPASGEAEAVDPVVEETAVSSPGKITATQVRLVQESDFVTSVELGEEERPFFGHITHQQPITLEVDFEMSGWDMPLTAFPHAEYRTHCHLHNLSTGKQSQLMDMQVNQSTEKRPFYSAKLADLSLEPGMYELGILVRGTNPLSTNYVKLPKLNVL